MGRVKMYYVLELLENCDRICITRIIWGMQLDLALMYIVLRGNSDISIQKKVMALQKTQQFQSDCNFSTSLVLDPGVNTPKRYK